MESIASVKDNENFNTVFGIGALRSCVSEVLIDVNESLDAIVEGDADHLDSVFQCSVSLLNVEPSLSSTACQVGLQTSHLDRISLMKPEVNFKHSGDLGDIVYSLPVVRSLGGGQFHIDSASTIGGKQPLGVDAASAMLPLLASQSYIMSPSLYNDEEIDIDLDAFRSVGRSIYSEHLSHSHCRGLGIAIDSIDLSKPWLTAAPRTLAPVVVCRTGRRNGILDWKSLSPFLSDSLFVGHWQEYKRFRSDFGFQLPFYHARDALDLAQIVAGASLVVSDQTFVFALAEGLKVPRVLEVLESAPNCLPQSENGHTTLSEQLIEHYLHHSDIHGHSPTTTRVESTSAISPSSVTALSKYVKPASSCQKVVGFWHICAVNHWKGIVGSQMSQLHSSGLVDRLDALRMGVAGKPDSLRLLEKEKFHLAAYAEAIDVYEFLTLQLLYEHCTEEDGIVFYIHTKGVSKSPHDANVNDWRSLLEHFSIDRHLDCIRALEDHDICGVNWQETPRPHFSGNFWWARADYIRRLSPPELPHDRLDAEFWVGGSFDNIRPRWKSLHQSNVNHYHQRYPRELYAR